jgi:hypothetical protein
MVLGVVVSAWRVERVEVKPMYLVGKFARPLMAREGDL